MSKEGDLTGSWRNYQIAEGAVDLSNLAAGVAAALTAGFTYTFLTNTEATDPGAGKLKFDKAFAEATTLRISETDKDGNALAAFLATIDDSTSAVKGRLIVRKVGEPKVFAIFNLTGGLIDSGTWDSIGLAFVAGTGLANNDEVTVEFQRTGDKGDQGEKAPKGRKGPKVRKAQKAPKERPAAKARRLGRRSSPQGLRNSANRALKRRALANRKDSSTRRRAFGAAALSLGRCRRPTRVSDSGSTPIRLKTRAGPASTTS